MDISLYQDVTVTFPTRLKRLYIGYGQLGKSNIGDVALEVLSGWKFQITLDILEKLPKTLRNIDGSFDPPSLEQCICEMFPLLSH